jgi:glycosyltransferase involved in cell wall biosynthesis
MKILSLTAGAAQMYCGSCLRDNTLAAELKREGHDVVLLPLYTPTRTDDANVSDAHIFFGGISIYLENKWPLFRRLPRFFDRIWDSRRALDWASRSQVSTSPKMLGELTVSMLQSDHGPHLREVEKLVEWLAHEPAPDVISLPYTLLLGLARPLRDALKRPLVCFLQGEDLFLEGLPEPYRTQSLDLIRENLQYVDAFLPVSHYYAGFMSTYLGIPDEKMHVVPIGIHLDGFDPSLRIYTNCFTVGYFARVAPEKSLHRLCEAYRYLRKETDFSGATLEVAGYLAPEHSGYLREAERRMKEWNLGQEFQYRGVLDRAQKIDFLRSLDVLSVPSEYHEPKGIYLLEAMAVGTPVIQPNYGAFPEVIGKTGGGVLFDPAVPHSLEDAIYSFWKNRQQARELGKRGAAGVREHYTSQHMARAALAAYSRYAAAPALG